jgi:hypothetical protein
MKFCSIRGQNWVDARVKVTRIIEKTDEPLSIS